MALPGVLVVWCGLRASPRQKKVHRTYDQLKQHATLRVSYADGADALCTAAGTVAKVSFLREVKIDFTPRAHYF
jgi:hypothetical protein